MGLGREGGRLGLVLVMSSAANLTRSWKSQLVSLNYRSREAKILPNSSTQHLASYFSAQLILWKNMSGMPASWFSSRDSVIEDDELATRYGCTTALGGMVIVHCDR